MKKNLWIWAIAALSMAACTSEDAPTQEQIVTENDFESPDGRVVVQLGAENSSSVTVASRAPIEGTNITELKDLGIFALNRNQDVTFTDDDIKKDGTGKFKWLDNDNCLLVNVKAEGTEADPLDKNVNPGKRLTLSKADGSGSGAVYYYPMQGGQNFNFYGYQPRTGSEVITNDGKIQVTMTLDGDKDLITGITNNISEAEETQYNIKGCAPTVNELYATEAKEGVVATIDNEYYPGYNAKYIRKIKYHNWIIDKSIKDQLSDGYRLNVNDKKSFIPNIEFVHRLAKLNFQVITAEAQAGDGNEETTENQGDDKLNAAKLRVKDIKLINVLTQATLTIEPDMTLAFSNRNTDGLPIHLIEKTGVVDKQTDGTYIITPQVHNKTDYEYTDENGNIQKKQGKYDNNGYLMVPATADNINSENPNDIQSYKISLVVIAENANGEPNEQPVTLSLENQTFEAGKSYNIRIALYAQQEVEVSATLTNWIEASEDVEIPVE